MKVSNLFAGILIAGSVCLAVTSCGSDDETPGTPGEGTNPEKPTRAYVYYQVTVTKDLKSAIDMKAVYTQANGLNDTVVVNDTVWSKTIEVGIPFSGKVKALFSKKEGFEPTKDKYKIGTGGIALYNYQGGSSFQVVTVTGSSTVSAQKLDLAIDRVLAKTYEWKVEVKE